MFKKVAGTKDILPQETTAWQRLEALSRDTFSLYNYQEIRPPVIEEASLFNRSLGEFTEVVQKQMFLIKNADEVYALRPEGTASIVRAYIENNLDKSGRLSKFYYIGPMFRLERPQKGRLRQFHHIGVEVIGSAGPQIDVEVISLAERLLKTYGVTGYRILVNSLGCPDDKAALVRLLKDGLKNKLGELCEECNARYNNNVLRILDCKNEECRKVVDSLNISNDHLCQDCKAHFDQVKTGLDDLKVAYEVMPRLVRGLDYYTRTVFEITHPGLGSQDAVCAGGRYDNLVSQLGGAQTPAIGFAFGVERLLLAAPQKEEQSLPKGLIFILGLGEAAKKRALVVLEQLRSEGLSADTDYEGRSLKGAMRLANDYGAKFCLIIGDNELQKGTVMLKNMSTGEQKEVDQQDLIKELKDAKNS